MCASALLGLMLAITSCGSLRQSKPVPPNTDGLFGAMPADSVSMADIPWQQLFADTVLQQYIAEALAHNPDMGMALASVQESEAYFRQGKAALLPTLNARTGASYARNSRRINAFLPREQETYQLTAEIGWEIDIWGKIQAAKRSAYAALIYSQAGTHAVQTRLVAAVASAYFSLMALDARMEITRQSVAYHIRLTETMKALQQSGVVTGAAIVQSEATRYAAEVMIPELKQQLVEAENSFALLLGRTPGSALPRATLPGKQSGVQIRTGVPAMLLRNRPDVIQSEMNVVQAYEAVNIARAGFYPSVTLSASAGLTSAQLGTLLDPVAFAANMAGSLAQPILNKRTNRTRWEVAKAQRESALLGFRLVLLQAGAEVQNALSEIELVKEKMALRQRQITALELSVEYSGELLKYGKANYIEVLTAQQSLLNARLNAVSDHLEQLTSEIMLYKALGGGWK